MTLKNHYSKYVTDEKLLSSYNAYQDKDKDNPRESDKVSAEILHREFVTGADRRILDIACSTGNFLRHLRQRLKDASLTGADLAVSSIEKCQQDPSLSGIEFKVADCLNLAPLGPFDAVTANAVTFLFDWPDYHRALRSIHDVLKPGGVYVGFELIHPFSVQDLTIVETNDWNPAGFTLRFRPMKKVEAALHDAGFAHVEFCPFVLPIDLPLAGYDADVVTYTRKDENGERMAFRGVLYQPWCHMVARKPV
jgi:SAM-dependent methyltransferase